MLPASTAAVQIKTRHKPRVLIVDDEPALVELINDVVGGLQCKVTVARTIAQAKKLLKGETFELMLTDVNLPDGNGTTLLNVLRRHQPTASAIVITGAPSVDGAITALRSGAVDFLPKPFDNDHLVERVRKALEQQSVLAKQEKRLVRLRDAVKRLGIARRMVSKKVDLLCNDLVSAYGELSKQLDIVRTQENFRKTIEQSKDLEQLLCHTM
ncbi:MAG TPA: response regulator, partial [Tepidisphaeraceae bacterium]|nr:response regulator [Tepidisphaeraceae bacterium]